MTRRTKVAFAALVAVTVCLAGALAEAQPGRGGPGGRGGGMFGGGGMSPTMLLRFEQVQKEIDLSEEQKGKLTKIGESLRDSMRERFSGLRDLSAEDREKKFREIREEMEKQTKKIEEKINDELLPHQIDRLKEIRIQVLGSRALADEEVAKALKITEKQKEDIQKASNASREEIRALFSGMGELSAEERREKFAGIREKMEKMRKDAGEAGLKVLTDEQRKQFDKMKGKEFKLDFSQMRGRGGRPGGGEGRGGRPGGGQGRPGGSE